MFRQITKCLLDNHSRLRNTSATPKLGLKVGYQGLFGISNYEMQSYVPFMYTLYHEKQAVFRTYRIISGSITSTSIDIASLFMFFDMSDEDIQKAKDKIKIFCENHSVVRPEFLDIIVRSHISDGKLCFAFEIKAYGEFIEVSRVMSHVFEVQTDWLEHLDRNAFDFAFDSPLLTCYALFHMVAQKGERNRLAIAFNTSFSKKSCKSIAFLFIAHMCMRASENEQPGYRVMQEVIRRYAESDKVKARFVVFHNREASTNKPVIDLFVESKNKQGVTSGLSIFKANTGVDSKGNPSVYTAPFFMPLSVATQHDACKMSLKPGCVVKLNSTYKEYLDRIFDIRYEDSLEKDPMLRYAFWSVFEEDSVVRSSLYNLENGQVVAEIIYDVYVDVIAAIRNGKIATIHAPVIYDSLDYDWTYTKEYHKFFILINKLLAVGVNKIEITGQDSQPFQIPVKVLAHYSDFQSDENIIEINKASLTFKDKSRIGSLSIS